MSTALLSTRKFETNVSSPITSDPIVGHESLILANHILNILGGQVLLPLFLITLVITGEAKRNPLLCNFCFSWILYSTINLILFYGGHNASQNPSLQLCMVQAALNYGAQAMTVITSCGIVIQAWHYLKVSTIPDAKLRIYGWRTTTIVILSYVALFGFAAAAVIVGVNFPDNVGRTFNIFVCDIAGHHLAESVGWLCLLGGFLIFVLGIWIMAIIYKNRYAIRYWRLQYTSSDFGTILRTLVFLLYGIIVVVFSVLSIFGFSTDFLYMFTACVPLLSFIIFGSRTQTISAWRKWLHLPPSRSVRRLEAAYYSTNLPAAAVQRKPEDPERRQGSTGKGKKKKTSNVTRVKDDKNERDSRKKQQSVALMRRGWSDASEIYQHSPPAVNPQDMLRQHKTEPSGLSDSTTGDYNGKATSERSHPFELPSDTSSDGRKIKRPAIIEWTSEPFLPIAAKYQSSGPY